MMLACTLEGKEHLPGNVLSIRSQQNLLAKGSKRMTGQLASPQLRALLYTECIAVGLICALRHAVIIITSDCVKGGDWRGAGVITLEDVLEEVIQDEIIDETDNFENNEHSIPVVRRPGRDRPDVSAYLALFEHKIREQNKLSAAEVQAVSAFLLTAVPEFAIFASVDTVLKARRCYISLLLFTLFQLLFGSA